MNAKVFKNLIKEAVREAVREEIGVLLLEQKKQELNENKSFSFTSNDIPTNGDARSATCIIHRAKSCSIEINV